MKDNSDIQMQSDDSEIDLVEVIQKLWRNRRLIKRVTLVFVILGLLVAIFTPVEYTAGCIMVPQTNEANVGGNLGGLAALAGINLGSMGASEVLPSTMYPKIINSVPFQKELMQIPLTFEKYEESITVLDFFTNPLYRKFSLFGFLKKYTLGLSKFFRSKKPIVETQVGMQSLSQDEKECIDILKNKIELLIEKKEGYVSLKVMMPEALAAAQLAEAIQSLLQKYVTEFKIEKVQSNLNFVQERYNEVQKEFEQIQLERAIFRDANKNLSSAKAQTEQERIDAQYDLSLSIRTELAKQLEQTKIQVKETTPILTIVDPVTIPFERSKPKRVITLILFTFFGCFCGIALIFTLPFIANILANERIRKMVK
ncbi:lipopolysaccharide biosynthesis protein [Odoribacter sp. OttesenSCG-928-A06]|nr:lipopolysaccharide biosynthesis protein [Odoribacter sp. OttesenSCG-928-A06]